MEGKTNGMSIAVKKVLSIFIILSVLTSCMVGNAMADGFSVRNGIRFGMSFEEVKATELQNGVVVSDPEQRMKEVAEEYGLEYEVNESDFGKQLTASLSIAGFDHGYLCYDFTSDKLTNITYKWTKDKRNDFELSEEESVKQSLIDQYTTLYESLSDKYEQIGYHKSKREIVFVNLCKEDERLNDFYGRAYYGLNSDADYTVLGFAQYIVKDNDNYVEIVISLTRYQAYLVEYYTKNDKTAVGIEYELFVKYRSRDKEQIDTIINDVKDKEKQRNTDL